MRLMKLELKRVLKTRLTLILLALSLLLSLVMAYIPTTFSYVEYLDENGNTVTLWGLDAVRYEKALQADTAGIVTPQKVRRAVESYQFCMTEYGARYANELPDGVYAQEILPYFLCFTVSGRPLPIRIPASLPPHWTLLLRKWMTSTAPVRTDSLL